MIASRAVVIRKERKKEREIGHNRSAFQHQYLDPAISSGEQPTTLDGYERQLQALRQMRYDTVGMKG